MRVRFAASGSRRPSSSSRSTSGSSMRPKFVGKPLCHQMYCVSGSPPGWLRKSMASKAPPIASLIVAAWSSVDADVDAGLGVLLLHQLGDPHAVGVGPGQVLPGERLAVLGLVALREGT